MAQSPKNKTKAGLLALPDETTYAIVELGPKAFTDANGTPDANFVTASMTVAFNGDLSGTIGQSITYAVGSSKTQVQTAVRNFVNSLLAETEPGNTLNNAHIILGGLSD